MDGGTKLQDVFMRLPEGISLESAFKQKVSVAIIEGLKLGVCYE